MENIHLKYHEALRSLGLEAKQADIYLAAIAIGGGSIIELARAGNIERTGIYYHINRLLSLGLLQVATRGRRNIYLPLDPTKLRRIVRQKAAQLEEVLPSLQDLFALRTGKSIVTYYQGKQGLMNLYEELYGLAQNMKRDHHELLIFGHSFEALEALPDFFPKFIARRSKLGVPSRVILPQSERPPKSLMRSSDPEIIARYNLHISDRRYLDKQYNYTGAVLITRNHVATIDFKTYFGAITESKNLAQTWRMFFQFIWDHLPDESSTNRS